MAAVAAYLRMEAESVAFHSMSGKAWNPPPERIHLWGMSGRQDQMQMRLQMQLKAYHR